MRVKFKTVRAELLPHAGGICARCRTIAESRSVGMERREAGSAAERGTGAARRPARRPTALFAVIAVACVAVPAVFTTRVQAVFVVPKLGLLWGLLAVCIGIAAFQTLFLARPFGLRPVWVVDAAVVSFMGLTTLAGFSRATRSRACSGSGSASGSPHDAALRRVVLRCAEGDLGRRRSAVAARLRRGGWCAGRRIRAGAEDRARPRLGRFRAGRTSVLIDRPVERLGRISRSRPSTRSIVRVRRPSSGQGRLARRKQRRPPRLGIHAEPGRLPRAPDRRDSSGGGVAR